MKWSFPAYIVICYTYNMNLENEFIHIENKIVFVFYPVIHFIFILLITVKTTTRQYQVFCIIVLLRINFEGTICNFLAVKSYLATPRHLKGTLYWQINSFMTEVPAI